MKKENVTISSPDELNAHLQSSSPVTWIALGTVIALVLGLFVWSGVYELPIMISGAASVTNGIASLTVEERAKDKLEAGQIIYILDKDGYLSYDEDNNPVVLNINLSDGQYTYRTDTELEKIRPIQYLFR